MGAPSAELFDALYKELSERGLHGAAHRLAEYRAAVQAETNVLLAPAPNLPENKIQAGLPAEEPQPTEVIP